VKKLLVSAYSSVYKYLPVQVRRALRGAYDAAGLRDYDCKESVASLEESYRRLGMIGHGDLVFDIGANVGAYTDAFARLGAKVVSVEPLPSCAIIMRKKFSGNSMITIDERGVGAAEGELDLHVSGTTVASTFSEKFKSQEESKYKTDYTGKVRVGITTLDSLIAKYGMPKYCKMDVEGFERQALSGLTKKVPFLSFEFHPDALDETGWCLSYLEKIGYKEFACDREAGTGFELEPWAGREGAFAAAGRKAGGGNIFAR